MRMFAVAVRPSRPNLHVVKKHEEAWAILNIRPHHSPRRTAPDLLAQAEALRRQRWTGVRIAQATGPSRATVSRILVRLKLNKIRMLEPRSKLRAHSPGSERVHKSSGYAASNSLTKVQKCPLRPTNSSVLTLLEIRSNGFLKAE
jgi:hypothetical protein